MSKWLIPEQLIQIQSAKQANSFIQPCELATDEIAIFNKNALNYQYFSNCKKLNTHYASVGESDTLDPYFARVIEQYG